MVNFNSPHQNITSFETRLVVLVSGSGYCHHNVIQTPALNREWYNVYTNRLVTNKTSIIPPSTHQVQLDDIRVETRLVKGELRNWN